MQLVPYAYFPLSQDVHELELGQVKQSESNVEQAIIISITQAFFSLQIHITPLL